MTTDDAPQNSLPLSVVRASKVDISDEVISKRSSMREALRLCAELAPIDDKVIAAELEIDPAQWSRIKSGQAHFPDEKYNDVMDICGNEVPLRWLALSRGYGLIRLKSTVEAELETEREKVKQLEAKLAHFEEFISLNGAK